MKGDRRLYEVFDLADVSGPRVRGQELDRLLVESAGRTPRVGIEALHEARGEEGQILESLAERREADLRAAEAEVEVFAESLARDPRREVRVRGGDHANVNLRGCGAPDRPDLAFLEDAEEPCLEIERDLGDLVEEERPAVRLPEDPFVALHGPGKGPALVRSMSS
ncbi:MAG: hypothetical protein HY720_14020 [Planctomycetes bacterium]|nr:hypothetical protein [Planctomycetota bacterium]